MNRILLSAALYLTSITTAFAAYTPIYAGLQMDNASVGLSLGYLIDKTYALEAHYTKSDTHISSAGITADTSINATGLSLLGMLPMKLSTGTPYFLFAKAGYERYNKEEKYYIPSSVTLSLPYSSTITSLSNRVLVGGGVQYDFYPGVNGRVGVDFVGGYRSVYIGGILKF